jgi:SAM-dependent methyltransferase
MNTTASLTPISAAERPDDLNAASQGPEACPVCGQVGVRDWLRAPDRFHGRHHIYSLTRCPKCSLVWLSHPPEPEEMHLHYTDAYHKLISAAGQNSPDARWGFRKVAIEQYKKSGAILDLGCSSGSFLEYMGKDAWKPYGIEMSAECARQAEACAGAEVFVGGVLDASFPRESFDVITCFDVLEHLYEPQKVMARVSEWLKPGGIFYVLVPNVECAEARIFGTYWHGLELPRHLFHYSPASLKFLANAAGLEALSLEAHQNPAVGTSMRYVGDDVFQKVGIRRTPVAYRDEPSLPWRVARKAVRMTALPVLLALSTLVGGGGSIHAMFRKPLSGSAVDTSSSSKFPQTNQ